MSDLRERIWDVVARSCQFLDDEEYGRYLDLLDDEFTYTISYYSPDLRKDMVLLQHTKKELAILTDNIKNHVRLSGRLFRQAHLYQVNGGDGAFDATSYLTVVHTDQDGISRLFCVGRYLDRVAANETAVRLISRHVRMDTRDIGPGCHFPL